MTQRPAIAPRYAKALRKESLDRMRAALHRMNPSMVLMWRLGLGPIFNMWPSVGGRMLVLIHTGRKTGTIYRTPLNYAPVGEAFYSLAGFGPGTDWYRNVLAHPDVEVWLPSGRWSAIASEASGDPDRTERMRDVLIASGFAARAIGLEPLRMTDEDLESATRAYRLVRLTATRRHSPGPADLVWVWSIALVLYAARARWHMMQNRKD